MEEPEEKQKEKKELAVIPEEETYEEAEFPDEWGDAFQDVREYLKYGNVDAAQEVLDSVGERSAEWHFAQAQIFMARYWFLESRNSLQEAIRLDPENKRYKKELKKLDKMAKKAERDSKREMGVGGICAKSCATLGCWLCCEFLCCRPRGGGKKNKR